MTCIIRVFDFGSGKISGSNNVIIAALTINNFNEISSFHSTLINPMVVQVLKTCDDWKKRTVKEEENKNEIHLLGRCWELQLLHW